MSDHPAPSGVTPASVTVREATLTLMRNFGLTTVFGNPGSTELPMFRDFPDGFRYVLGLQESIVMGMADGYAQATGGAAFVNLHSAAGVGHALGNLFTAYKNQTPLVVTAGQQARSILPYEPYLFADRASEFPRPYVKWSAEPARAEDVPLAIARAYYMAMQPPRGPTFVSIPVDDWDKPCEPVAPRRVSRVVVGDPDDLRAIARALARATSPAIIVGAGVARDDAWDEVVALAERHQARVWAAPMSARNSFPEDHALFQGFLPASREAIVRLLTGNDLILGLGGAISLYHTEGFGPHLPPGSVYLLVDDPALASLAPSGTAVVTHLKRGVRTLLDGAAPAPRSPPAARVRPGRLDGERFTDAYVLQQIAELRPQGAVIVEEAPSSRAPLHDHLPMIEKDSFFCGASGGLGHGLPAAIGYALGAPERKVIALLGDGSAMYAIQALWTAAHLKLPISFIIINNHRYEALVQFGRHFGIDDVLGVDLDAIDFVALAKGQGVDAVRVETREALDAALQASFAAAEPNLVEVVVN